MLIWISGNLLLWQELELIYPRLNSFVVSGMNLNSLIEGSLRSCRGSYRVFTERAMT
jgi:hypothetical protein